MKNFTWLLIVFYSVQLVSQTAISHKIFYNDKWIVVDSTNNPSYYRLFNAEDSIHPIGRVNDYYITGEMQGTMDSAAFIDKVTDANSKFIGKTVGYFKSGNKNFELLYDSSSNALSNINWYENGNKKWEIKYDKNIETSISYYENGIKFNDLRFMNGLAEGTCMEYYQSGKLKNKSIYHEGVLKNEKYIECDEFNNCQQVYYDGFNTNESYRKWDVIDNSDVKAQFIAEAGYQIENKLKTDISFRIYQPFDIEGSFSAETNFKFVKGDEKSFTGLIFGYLNWDNYSYFYISPNGKYKIGHVLGGLFYDGAIVKSTFINLGTEQNCLKLSMYNNKMQYAVNGHIVLSEPFVTFRGNNIGYVVGGKSEALFQNLIIKENVDPQVIVNELSTDWNGNGSGFFIDTTGVIVTNYHVIEGANTIEVSFLINGLKKSFKAKVISSDKNNDLAIIKIDDSDFKPFKKIPYSFKNSVSDVGSNVFAMGYPMALNVMGEEVKFNDGKISSKSGYQGETNTYQISVPVQSGNSGGPLFDYDGNIIGVVNSKLVIGDNVAYAIKSGYLNTLVETLPFNVNLPSEKSIATKSLTEKIKVISDYVVLIKVR